MEFSAIVRRGADVRPSEAGLPRLGLPYFAIHRAIFQQLRMNAAGEQSAAVEKAGFLSQLIAVAARWVTMICVLPFSRSDSRARQAGLRHEIQRGKAVVEYVYGGGFAAHGDRQALFLSARKVSATLGNRITEPLRLRRDKTMSCASDSAESPRRRLPACPRRHFPAPCPKRRCPAAKRSLRCRGRAARSFPSRPFRPGAKPLPSARKAGEKATSVLFPEPSRR